MRINLIIVSNYVVQMDSAFLIPLFTLLCTLVCGLMLDCKARSAPFTPPCPLLCVHSLLRRGRRCAPRAIFAAMMRWRLDASQNTMRRPFMHPTLRMDRVRGAAGRIRGWYVDCYLR